MSNTPAQHFAHITVEHAAEVITNGTSSFTPEQLAGWYAFDAALDAAFGFEDGNISNHLDFIRGVGANFDHSQAMIAARQYAAQHLQSINT